ncbi:MAG TPA: helix-turn-helix transcriptional regulator [Pseudomonadota bacterium]|jgi:DNA-binding XRE family transcriptional regulator|nr:helix-turn-helix transcriptional regulator [Pseudomonadota bacterium]
MRTASHVNLQQRFAELLRYSIHRGWPASLIQDNIAPHRMALFRWQSKLPDDLIVWAVVKWFEKQGVNAEAIYSASDADWAKVLKLPDDLRVLRRARGLTQSDVAQALDLSRFTYLRLERGNGTEKNRERALAYLKAK